MSKKTLVSLISKWIVASHERPNRIQTHSTLPPLYTRHRTHNLTGTAMDGTTEKSINACMRRRRWISFVYSFLPIAVVIAACSLFMNPLALWKKGVWGWVGNRLKVVFVVFSLNVPCHSSSSP